MVLGTRNIELFNEVQRVYLKTTRPSFLENFSELYTTFSKTKLSVSGKMKGPGIIYSVKLDCYVPGFNAVKLAKVNSLGMELFSIKLELTSGDFIQISSLTEPLELNTSTTPNQTTFTFSGQTTSYISNASTDSNTSFSYVFPVSF